MLKIAALAGCAALSAGALAFAGSASAQNMQPTHDFLMKAGASDKFEITEAKIAEMKSHNPHIKKFASMMIQAHTKSTMMLKTAAQKDMGHKIPPPQLMPEQEKMIADLKATHGRDFDKTYVDQQMQAHQMALSTMQDYAANGDSPRVKATAAKIVPVVQMHIDHLKDIQTHMQ